MSMLTRHRGQSIVEYTFLGALVVAAVLAMQIFMKRSLMGKWEEAGKQMGEQFQPHQYTANYTLHHDVERQETTTTDGQATSEIRGKELQERTDGEEHINLPLQDEQLFY